MNSSKLETQHDTHEIYSYVIETPQASWRPNIEYTERKHVLKNNNADLQK